MVIDELVWRMVLEGGDQIKRAIEDTAKTAERAQKQRTTVEKDEQSKRIKAALQAQQTAERGMLTLIAKSAKEAGRLRKEAAKQAAKDFAESAAGIRTAEFNRIRKAQQQAVALGTPTSLPKAASGGIGSMSLDKAAGVIASIDQRITGLITKLAQLGGVGIVAGLGAAVATVKSFADEASRLRSVADFTSLTTQRFQELAFAAEQNGMSAEKLADGFRQFNAGMRESAKSGGLGSVAEGVKDLGINFKDLQELRPDQQFMMIMDAANKAGPSMHRAGAFAKIYGEIAGADLARVADQGTESLERLAAQAHDLGLVMSDDAVKAGIKLKQQLGQIGAIATGLKNSIGLALVPTVTQLIERLRNWVVQNRELIVSGVQSWVERTTQAVKELVPTAMQLFRVAADLLPVLVDMAPTLAAIVVSIKALNTAGTIAQSVSALSSAFGGAASAVAFLAGPGGIAAMGLALAAAIPLAWEFGKAMGRVADVKPQSLADRILAAKFVRPGGGSQTVEGQSTFADEIAKLSERDRRGLEAQVFGSGQGRDFRNTGIYRRLFGAADERISQAETEAGQKEFARTLADELSKKTKSGKFVYSESDIQSLVDQGLVSEDRARLELGQRGTARFTGKRQGAEKDKAVTDAELAKLIAQAAKSGANLDELLKGRKIAGGVPPVITLRMFTFQIQSPITVNGAPGQSPTQLAQSTSNEWATNLERELQRHMPTVLEAR
jgi:hypothetical protein